MPPERRIFYVDVGNLPKVKAEQYLRDVMNRYRNKLSFTTLTTERFVTINDTCLFLKISICLDAKVVEVQKSQLLMVDKTWVRLRMWITSRKKLYRSLNIPISRLEAENGFNMGRSAEITRDELKFFKFVDRLRHRFSDLFLNALRVQLIMKGVMTEDDWNLISPDIQFDYTKDSYFTELKENEILKRESKHFKVWMTLKASSTLSNT